MPSAYEISLLDSTREVGKTRIAGETITSTNFTLQDGYMDQLRSAIEGVTNGVVVSERRLYENNAFDATPPTDPASQREHKWTVIMQDTVTLRKFKIQIPCADESLIDIPSEDMKDSTQRTALVQALENYVRSPAGNPVEVLRIFASYRNV